MRKKYYKTEDRRKFYKEKFLEQEGRCAICGELERLVINHNHTTGDLRGLLCYSHNSGLGLFQDNPSTLRKAIGYLERCGYSSVAGNEEQTWKNEIISVMETLLSDENFKSDRARARELAKRVGISYGCAQTRISRIRQKK